jgi:hypothetical protein
LCNTWEKSTLEFDRAGAPKRIAGQPHRGQKALDFKSLRPTRGGPIAAPGRPPGGQRVGRSEIERLRRPARNRSDSGTLIPAAVP